jgi:hypothetical protein
VAEDSGDIAERSFLDHRVEPLEVELVEYALECTTQRGTVEANDWQVVVEIARRVAVRRRSHEKACSDRRIPPRQLAWIRRRAVIADEREGVVERCSAGLIERDLADQSPPTELGPQFILELQDVEGAVLLSSAAEGQVCRTSSHDRGTNGLLVIAWKRNHRFSPSTRRANDGTIGYRVPSLQHEHQLGDAVWA